MQIKGVVRSAGRRSPAAVVLVLAGSMWLSGCVQQTVKVSGAWQDSAPRGQTFKKVLVVGVTPRVNQRCAFEFFMASQISSDSTRAIASCDAVKKKDPLTAESIQEAVASTGADAVIATKLIARDWETQEGGSRDTRGGGYYKATDMGYAVGYYGWYGMPVVVAEFSTAEPVTTAEGVAHIASRVYETQGKSVVYTLDTKARGLISSDVAMHDIAAAIAEQLREDGLVR